MCHKTKTNCISGGLVLSLCLGYDIQGFSCTEILSHLEVVVWKLEKFFCCKSSKLACVVLFPQQNCSKVKSFLRHRLGKYITNVTRAAEVCSDFLCQGNGRCVRRDPLARHYLHLSADSYRIRLSADGDFAVTGWHSQYELQLLTERFRCRCYEGHEGERCDSINKVREDDGLWREEEEEQERRRTEWEDEQGERWDRGESEASWTRYSLHLVLLMLLLNLLLVKTVM